RHDVAETETVSHQPCRVGQHVELPFEAAYRVHFDDTRHGAELRLDDPVLHDAQINRTDCAAVGVFGALLGFDGKHEDLAEAGRDRTHRQLDAGRQLVL